MNYCKVSHCRFKTFHTTKSHLCGKCKKYGHGIIECNNNNSINNLKCYFYEKMKTDDQCSFAGCVNKEYHNTNGHHCENCHDRLHSRATCPLLYNTSKKNENYEITCPICKKDNIINVNQSKIYGLEELCIICMDKCKEVFFPACGHICVCIECNDKLKKTKYESDFYCLNYDEDKLKSLFKNYPSYTIIYQGMGSNYIFRRINISSEIEYIFIHSDDHYTEDVDKKLNDFINGHAFISYNI